MSRPRLTAILALSALVGFISTSLPRTAEAIPAFSRKYATSCATCHVAYPKLNGFGKAFRNNGYRMPGGDDEYLKDENIKLGADPWKRLWPKAIWPGDIPYQPPLSVLVQGSFEYTPDNEVTSDFRVPSDVAVLTGGSLGDSLSWYGRINLVAPGEEVHIHQMFGQFNSLFKTSLVNLRVGQIEPRAVPFSSVHRLTKTDYLFNRSSLPLEAWVDYLDSLPDPDHGDEIEDGNDESYFGLFGRNEEDDLGDAPADDDHDEFENPLPDLVGLGGHAHSGAYTLGTTQLGMELWGATSGFGGRGGFEYAVGLVNGNGRGEGTPTESFDNNSAKDVYWRASYKIGGLSVMGDPTNAPAVSNNWRDDSVRVGVFGYHGTAPFDFAVEPEPRDRSVPGSARFALRDPGEQLPEVITLAVDERFRRIGADLDLWYGNLNLFGAYMWGKAEMDPALLAEASTDYRSFMAEADYVFYPWLVGALRYERIDYEDAFGDVQRWVPNVTALLRANVRLTAEANLYSDDEAFRNRFQLWFDFAF